MTAPIGAASALSQFAMTPGERYRLVPLNGAGTHILLRQEAGHSSLLTFEIPRFRRVADEITSLLLDEYGLSAILLSVQPSGEPDTHYAVVEVCDENRRTNSLRWFELHTIVAHLGEADARFVHASQTQATEVPVGTDISPFSRLGWIYKRRNWAQDTVAPLGIRVGRFFHVSGSEGASLVKFESTQRPLWLKAVGQGDPREFENTQTLLRLLPEYLPRIFAVDPLLNAWLMDSGGEPLRHYEDVHKWKVVAQRLAAMQVDSVSLVPDLLDAGLRDLRFDALSGVLHEFFNVMADLMGQQTKSAPAPLSAQELCVIASTLEDAIRELSHLGIPDALGHHDFNPGNILIDGDSCVFTDWSAGHVGCPLYTFEYLLAHFRKSHRAFAVDCDGLRETYTAGWLSGIKPESISRALQLSPFVAVYASAIASGSWRDPERLARPGVPGYLRSLARIMKREMETLSQRREPCLNC